MKFDAENSPKQVLSRTIPLWILGLVSLVSLTLLLALTRVCFSPEPYVAPGLRDPKVIRQIENFRGNSALGRNMRLIDVYYYVVARQGEHFTVTYLNSKGKKVRVVDATATEVAGTYDNGAEVRSPDGILLKRWEMRVRVEAGSLLFVSAQSKQKKTLVEVSIWVDADDACRTIAKPGQKIVSCRSQMPK